MGQNGEEHYHIKEMEKLGGASLNRHRTLAEAASKSLALFYPEAPYLFRFTLDNSEVKEVYIDLEPVPEDHGAAIRDVRDLADQGGVCLAYFIMAVFYEKKYVWQTERGTGKDFRFCDERPKILDDNPGSGHPVEISGIFEEKGSNTLTARLKEKHAQIIKGRTKGEEASVIVTVFSTCTSVKQKHQV